LVGVVNIDREDSLMNLKEAQKSTSQEITKARLLIDRMELSDEQKMLEKVKLGNGTSTLFPELGIYSNEGKVLTCVLHKDYVPEGFTRDEVRAMQTPSQVPDEAKFEEADALEAKVKADLEARFGTNAPDPNRRINRSAPSNGQGFNR
jgi:hypothetical protein